MLGWGGSELGLIWVGFVCLGRGNGPGSVGTGCFGSGKGPGYTGVGCGGDVEVEEGVGENQRG